MQIVVLDGYTLNPGDLSGAGLEALGPTTVYGRTPPDQTAARAAESEIVLTNKTVLSPEIIRQLPRLRHLVIEQDPTTADPTGDMAASLRYLSSES